MPLTASAIAARITASAHSARRIEEPYRHYLVEHFFDAAVVEALNALPFGAPDLAGVSGRRELHNDQRSYADVAHRARFPVLEAIAEALQSQAMVDTLAQAFDAPLDDTFLRLEYACDTDGFWLEPHTDLGVKKFTCLIYLSNGPDHDTLGTDIYAGPGQHRGRSPFAPGSAMVFIPSDCTWHGFEKRPIQGVRKSLILNYVTHEWKAREQLSFPDQPVYVTQQG
jgi:hypothetical protein